ncbi:MAG TPA: transglycosylase SLT domain-containing protein [Baekduia sp.]|uniref:transglycosylase SLT domain-containing protein n=1 Tax=Baekduia sp. TaxID=2600305 RepID=UPI002C959C11|nr:transglycosylase SLT domain-containing protein [Baekduia sp.]HMJ37385.1 transglycosylase SLT domain-containing protein [Baekduia sp.]
MLKSTRSPIARSALLAVVVVLAAAAAVALLGNSADQPGPRQLAPGRGATDTTRDPLAYDGGARQDFERRAAAGLSHVLYAKSPGGAPATAARVARLRPLIEDVARRAHQDPDTLEAIVFLESAGRPDVAASSDLSSAVGLTQILAQTATDLLGLKVDVAASEKLTRRIARGGPAGRIRALAARRRKVDERFDPRKALEATTRYLEFAQGQLGRADLAVESYHMGVGNLQNALKAYGKSDIPYAQLFFDSTPLRHAAAWRVLAGLGDDSATYLWRIGAAKAIMSLYRDDPQKVAAQAALNDSPAGEDVLRPPDRTPRFADDAALQTSELVVVAGPALRPARALAAAAPARRALRPDALKLLRYLALGVREVAKTAPIVVTSASRSVSAEERSSQGVFGAEAPPSMHTTGFAFDVSRRYRAPAQAQALQFWLDRLTALDLIAWSREPTVIHVTVGPRATDLP